MLGATARGLLISLQFADMGIPHLTDPDSGNIVGSMLFLQACRGVDVVLSPIRRGSAIALVSASRSAQQKCRRSSKMPTRQGMARGEMCGVWKGTGRTGSEVLCLKKILQINKAVFVQCTSTRFCRCCWTAISGPWGATTSIDIN